jgi:hypothetical protein
VTGIVYGVRNLISGSIEKVGSTTRTLRQRTVGYRHQYDWFDDRTHALIPLRTVDHADADFLQILLKSVENCEIARQKTWEEQGGRNRMSPLVQWLNHDFIESEIGKIGGKVTAAIPGHMSRAGKIGGKKGGVIGGRINGNLSVRNGRLASMRTPEHQAAAGRRSIEIHGCPATRENCIQGGRISGKRAFETGQLASITTAETRAKGAEAACHIRWHIKRNTFSKSCRLCLQKEVV